MAVDMYHNNNATGYLHTDQFLEILPVVRDVFFVGHGQDLAVNRGEVERRRSVGGDAPHFGLQ